MDRPLGGRTARGSAVWHVGCIAAPTKEAAADRDWVVRVIAAGRTPLLADPLGARADAIRGDLAMP